MTTGPTQPYAIGIDLGGTSVKTIVVSPEGERLNQSNDRFEDNSRMDWATAIREVVNRVQQEMSRPAECIGLSAPGLVSRDRRSIAIMPGRLQGLEGLDWTEFLRVGRPVPVLNDAHAALLGESWRGAAKGFENVILLTLGTGVGGAAMVDGRLLRGEIGRAGHLGHASLNSSGPADICRMPGSLELCIGNCTIEERSAGRFTTTHDLVAAHLAGDSHATEVWRTSIHHLACAIGSFVNILDPAAVIVGGGIAKAGNALFDPLREELDKVEWQPGGHKVKVLPALLGEFAGAYGAARQALAQS